MKIEQYISGQLPNPPPRIYKEAAERIKIDYADYANRPLAYVIICAELDIV